MEKNTNIKENKNKEKINKKNKTRKNKANKINLNNYVKPRNEWFFALDLTIYYIINYIILFIPTIIYNLKYKSAAFTNIQAGFNMFLINLPMFGIIVGMAMYLDYRSKVIANESLEDFKKKIERKMVTYNFVLHFAFILILYISKFKIFSSLDVPKIEQSKYFEELVIFICSYFFINVFSSFNIYTIFKSEYKIDIKSINKKLKKESEDSNVEIKRVRNSIVLVRYLKLFLIVSILNIPSLFLPVSYTMIFYAFSIIIATLPFILKNIRITNGKVDPKYEEELKYKKKLNTYMNEKVNTKKNSTKKRGYIRKIIDLKSIIAPYIFKTIFSKIIMFIIIFSLGTKIFNLENFEYIFGIVSSFMFLIDTYSLIIGLKIYDNYIKYGEKERKQRNKAHVYIGIITTIIFTSLIYLFPYKMMNIYTTNIASKNSAINILKFFLMTSVLSFISSIIIYGIYGNIRKVEIKRKKYRYLDMSSESKKIYKLNSVIFLMKVLFPYLFIILSMVTKKHKLFLYSYFLSDIIVIIFSLCIYIMSIKYSKER